MWNSLDWFFIQIAGSGQRLLHDRHVEIGAGANTRGPAGGNGLQLGIEVDALHAVDVDVAEQGSLPPTEAVESHGYGDRDIDSDHANLYS